MSRRSASSEVENMTASFFDAHRSVHDTSLRPIETDVLRALVASGSKVLEVGCGNGVYLDTVADRCQATGIDLSAVMVAAAKARLGDRATVRRMSALALDFPDGSFDMVFSFGTAVVVPGAERMVAEVIRVLRPGGTLLVDLGGRWNLTSWYWSRWYRRQGMATSYFTWRQVRRMLAELDVTGVESFGVLGQASMLPGIRSVSDDLDRRASRWARWFARYWLVVAVKR